MYSAIFSTSPHIMHSLTTFPITLLSAANRVGFGKSWAWWCCGEGCAVWGETIEVHFGVQHAALDLGGCGP